MKPIEELLKERNELRKEIHHLLNEFMYSNPKVRSLDIEFKKSNLGFGKNAYDVEIFIKL